MDKRYIYILNPWWKQKEAILNDRQITTYESSKFKFSPTNIVKEIDLNSSGVYTLRGPRQVGKTTLLKLLIKDLILEKKVEPLRVLYITCDMIENAEELVEILVFYKRLPVLEDKKAFIFLDEITTVNNWQSAIKFLVDSGVVSNDLMVLTGSSAYDLKISSERLPGRRGKGKDLVYLPLSVKEVASAFGYACPTLTFEDIMSLSEDDLKMLEFKCAFMKDLFEMYITGGGFPMVVNELYESGEISEETLKVYFDFILNDAEKYLKSRRFLIDLLRILPDMAGQRVSWNSLIRKFSISAKTHDTVRRYFEYLSYSFVIYLLYFLDVSKKVIRPKKMKKLYPLDPIIAKVVENHTGRSINTGHKIEMVVLRHLLNRKAISIHGLDLLEGPYFWYSDRGNEIDFVVEVDNLLVPVEVKYQNKVTPGDYVGMKRVFGRGVVITKNDIFKDGKILGIPAWIFASVIDS